MENSTDRKQETIAYLNNMISSLKIQIEELEQQDQYHDPKDSLDQGDANRRLHILRTRLTELEGHLKNTRGY